MHHHASHSLVLQRPPLPGLCFIVRLPGLCICLDVPRTLSLCIALPVAFPLPLTVLVPAARRSRHAVGRLRGHTDSAAAHMAARVRFKASCCQGKMASHASVVTQQAQAGGHACEAAEQGAACTGRAIQQPATGVRDYAGTARATGNSRGCSTCRMGTASHTRHVTSAERGEPPFLFTSTCLVSLLCCCSAHAGPCFGQTRQSPHCEHGQDSNNCDSELAGLQ